MGRLFVPDVRKVVLDSFSSPEKVEHLQIRQHVLRSEHLWGDSGDSIVCSKKLDIVH